MVTLARDFNRLRVELRKTRRALMGRKLRKLARETLKRLKARSPAQ